MKLYKSILREEESPSLSHERWGVGKGKKSTEWAELCAFINYTEKLNFVEITTNKNIISELGIIKDKNAYANRIEIYYNLASLNETKILIWEKLFLSFYTLDNNKLIVECKNSIQYFLHFMDKLKNSSNISDEEIFRKTKNQLRKIK